MSNAVTLIGVQVSLFLVCVALGSGLVVAILPTSPLRLAWAPLIGLATATSTLASLGWIWPAERLAWAFLVPAAIASAVVAVVLLRRADQLGASLRELGWGSAAALVPGTLFAAPFVARGSSGPLALLNNDAWIYYVPLSERVGERPLSDTGFRAAVFYDGLAVWIDAGGRVGFEMVVAAAAGITGVDESAVLTPALGVAVMIIGATSFALARAAFALRPAVASAIGAAAGSTAMTLMVAFEAAGPSIIAYSLVPAALWFFSTAVAGSLRAAVLAGLLTSALVATYTEAMLALVLGGVVVALASLVSKRGRGLVRGTSAIAIAVAVSFASPVAVWRARDYVETLRAQDLSAVPDWGVDFANSVPLAFGLEHLFEGRRQELLSDWRLAGLLVVTAIGLSAVGLYFRFGRGRLWMGSTLAAATAVALFAEFGEGCNNCFYRGLAFLTPLLVMSAFSGLIGWQRAHPRARGPAVFVGVVLALGLVRGTASVVEVAYGSRTIAPGDIQELTAIVEGFADGAPVLVEGADSGYPATPFTTVNETMYHVLRGGSRPVTTADSKRFLAGAAVVEPEPYSPDYELVVTDFGGVSSGRRLISATSAAAVMRRAPQDVFIDMRGVWSLPVGVDPATGTPSINAPFSLVVSSPTAEPVTLVLAVTGPAHAERALVFRRDGRELRVVRTSFSGVTTYCARLPRATPSATVEVDPGPGAALPALVAPDQDATGLPRDLVITAARASAGGDSCGRRAQGG